MSREPKDGYSLATMRLISRELKKIREKYGAITADNVLEVAREPEHPLHRFFDWDDRSAAEKFRRQQATQMITRVVVSSTEGGKERTFRAFLGVDRNAQREYLPVAEVMSDEELRAQVVAEMKNDLEAMRRRYETYAFLAGAVAAVKKAIAVLDEKPARKRENVRKAG